MDKPRNNVSISGMGHQISSMVAKGALANLVRKSNIPELPENAGADK